MKETSKQFVTDYVREHGMAWPHYFDGKEKNPYMMEFGFSGVPVYLLIGKDGLLAVHTAGSEGLTNLEEVVRKQLGLPPLHPGDENKLLGGSRRANEAGVVKPTG